MPRPLRELCGDAATADELRRIVATRDPLSFSPGDIAIINRNAKRLEVPANFRMAYAGTHSDEPLPACFRAHAIGIGMGVADYVAPYGQYMQALLAEDSELVAFRPNLLFLSFAMRQLSPRLHSEFGTLSRAELIAERERIIEHMVEVAHLAARRLGATVLLGNFARPDYPAFGIADAKRELGEIEFYLGLNLELLQRFKDSDRIHIVDLDRLVGGARATSADRMFFLAKSLWTDRQCNVISQELMRYVVATTGQTRKCLVVDLDNTLWGGVAGEDGPDGVMVGPGSATAEAFESFQYVVRSLRARGIMLAICSKNNPADVEEVFSCRHSMPLGLHDFSATEISWDNKGNGIMNLAARLNIGFDSLVFADDNPAERTIVRCSVPGVEVLEMPGDPADYAGFLRRQVWFEKLKVNADDVTRLEHYAVEQQREQLRTSSSDLEHYLGSLGTEVRVAAATRSDVARIHELFNKTNQFNLTTRRYALADVEQFLERPEFILGVVTAGDRFGAMGTVGVYLVELQSGGARLDSFLMSCRALGRGIETAVMNCVKREVDTRLGGRTLDAVFVPTAKNAPCRDFLAQQGFELLARNTDGSASYRLREGKFTDIPCPHLKVIHEPDRKATTA